MESVTVPYTSSADAVKEGVGTNSGRSPQPNSSGSTLPSSHRSLSSHSDPSLPASSSAVTSLPTSVV